MTEQAWVEDDETIIKERFVEEHTDGNCIPTQKVKDAFNKMKKHICPDCKKEIGYKCVGMYAINKAEKELGL